MKHGNHKLLFSIILFFFYSFGLYGNSFEGNSVKLQILDKITAQIKTIEINVNDTYEYSTLKIEIYACYKRPPEEIPEDFVLLKINFYYLILNFIIHICFNLVLTKFLIMNIKKN